MKAWIKGGLIGAVIYLILIILPINLVSGDWPTMLKYISLHLGLPWTIGVSDYGIRVIISVLINFFILGAIIGWVIGKFKKSEKVMD